LGKEKAEKKAWSEMWAQRQVLLAGKFTFPDAKPLTTDDKTIAPENISIINVKDVTFSYNVDTGIWIFREPINFPVTASSRIGVMGPNGAGKSTLLKLICDKLKPVTGEVTRHPTATVAYFAQHHVMDLDLNSTPVEFMANNFPEEKSGNLRSHLAKVGIVGDKAETRMSSLSGGLRSCCCFAKITYFCPHLLIMDEPTNFLDLESIDALIAATNKYKGALLLVSHNRAFLLKCAKQYLSVVPGKFLLFDDLKNCERSTYQFIEEMESGVKVSAQSLVAKNPSADAALSVRTGAAAAASAAREAALKKDTDGGITISSTPTAKPVAKPATTTVVIPAEEKELVGKKCIAVWSADGGKYPATVTKALGKGIIEVQYTGYPDKANVKIKDVVIKK
jgi:ABC-type Mn2+/Zn2+ transport system ATPase subunit